MSASEATAGATEAGGSSGAKKVSPRPRRQTAFYSPETPTKKATLSVPKGTGSRLRDIPSIWSEVSKMRADDPLLIDVHRILYKRAGQVKSSRKKSESVMRVQRTKRKRSVGDFCGFKFKANEKESENDKLRERIDHVRGLRNLMEFFNLPVKSGKNKMTDALVAFLMKPKAAAGDDSGPASSAPKKETPTTKRAPKKVTVSRKRKSTKDDTSKSNTTAKRSSQSSSRKRKKQEEAATDEEEMDEQHQEDEQEIDAEEEEQQGSTEAPDASTPVSEEQGKEKNSPGGK